MTTFRRLTSAILVATLLSVSLRGQELRQSAGGEPYLDERAGLSLDQAIARALEQEPGLRAARREVDVAGGQRQQADLRRNPTLTFERRVEPGGTDRLTAVGVEWPLDLYRREGRVETAEQELVATRFEVADRERMLAGDVRRQYGAAAAAARDVSVTDELVTAVERQLDLARARASEGAIPPLERDVLEVDVRRLQAERARAAGRADVAMLQLKQLLGMSPDESLTLGESLETLVRRTGPAGPDSSPASGQARADVRQAEARVTLANARVEQAEREGRLDISLVGTYMRMDAGFPQSGLGPSGVPERVRGQFNYVSAGAMIGLPLFNRNQGDVARRQAERLGAEDRLEAASLGARSEAAAARARDLRAQEAVALYSGGTQTLARQNLDVVRQTFGLGRGTVFDVLAEQRRYLDFEQAYTAALAEAWDARASLKRALGDTK